MASSRRFEDLKDELISLKEKIRIQLRRNANEFIISKMFIEGDNLIESIKNEVEKCPATVMAEMRTRLMALRNEWTAFKATARRPALLSGGGGGYGAASSSSSMPTTTSAILNRGIESLERTGQSIQRSEIVAHETEEIGTAVVDELSGQREALIRTRERLDNTNVDLKKSHRLIRVINTTVTTNKCLLMVIIMLEIMIIMAIIYLRFIKH